MGVPVSDEVRMTDPATGGSKGVKLERLGAIDPLALRVLATVAGYGEQKYARHNYLKGFDWAWAFDAMMRHTLAFWEGEDLDPESGFPHMAHAAWHALSLVSFTLRGLGTDTRFKQDERMETQHGLANGPVGGTSGGAPGEAGAIPFGRVR